MAESDSSRQHPDFYPTIILETREIRFFRKFGHEKVWFQTSRLPVRLLPPALSVTQTAVGLFISSQSASPSTRVLFALIELTADDVAIFLQEHQLLVVRFELTIHPSYVMYLDVRTGNEIGGGGSCKSDDACFRFPAAKRMNEFHRFNQVVVML